MCSCVPWRRVTLVLVSYHALQLAALVQSLSMRSYGGEDIKARSLFYVLCTCHAQSQLNVVALHVRTCLACSGYHSVCDVLITFLLLEIRQFITLPGIFCQGVLLTMCAMWVVAYTVCNASGCLHCVQCEWLLTLFAIPLTQYQPQWRY